jgi:dUTP pyrophosphatase
MNKIAPEPLKFKKLSDAATIPKKGSIYAAGYDLHSAVDTKVPSKGKALVSTKLAVAVPFGSYGRVAPRSGLTWKNFIDVGAGVIDSDYRGECKLIIKMN